MLVNYGPASQFSSSEFLLRVSKLEKSDYQKTEELTQIRGEIGSLTSTVSEAVTDINGTVIKSSEIKQTIDDITSTVTGITEDGGVIDSKITQGADKITVSFNGQNKTLNEATDELKDSYDALKITVDNIQVGSGTSITWTTLDDSIKSQILEAQSTAESAQTQAGTAHSLALEAQEDASDALDATSDGTSAWNQVRAWVNGTGTTYIDGSMITAGTVIAKSLQGSEIGIYNSSGKIVAYMTPETTTSTGLTIDSSYSLRLLADNNLYLYSGANGNAIQFYDSNQPNSITMSAPSVVGKGSGSSLGTSSRKWTDIYASNGTIQTSDENKKNSIEALPDKYITMFDSIVPKRYKLNDGTSGRYHVGFISQEIEAAMTQAGIDSQEFGGFVKDLDENGDDIYMLRYDEFIGILTAKIKQLESRIEQLEA